MTKYTIPPELYEFYALIKRPLSRRMAILIMEGRTGTAAYKQASKELKTKLSKDPAKSAHGITSNHEFSRFINLARARSDKERVSRGFMSFIDRCNLLEDFATLKFSRALSSVDPVNCSDAVAALGLLHKMQDGENVDKLAGMTDRQRRVIAVNAAKQILLKYDNDDE